MRNVGSRSDRLVAMPAVYIGCRNMSTGAARFHLGGVVHRARLPSEALASPGRDAAPGDQGKDGNPKPSPRGRRGQSSGQASTATRRATVRSSTMASVVPSFSPMLASSGPVPAPASRWAFEPKLDGWRVLVSIVGDLNVRTRNGHNVTTSVPELTPMVEALEG